MKTFPGFLALVCLISLVSSKVRTKRYIPEEDIWQIVSDIADIDRMQQKSKRSLTSTLNPGFLWSSTARWFPESYDYSALADKDLDKRVFDNLGGYEIHSYRKRDSQSTDDKFDGMRRSLGNQQSNRLKRLLDTLGGFQVHGWKKRALDSLGGYQVHGWKKRSLDSLGGFQVHGWKKRSATYPDFDSSLEVRSKRDAEDLNEINTEEGKGAMVKSENKRPLDDLGSFQIHGWKRSETSDGTGSGNDGNNFDKKSLENLGSFQIHGWKRSEGVDKNVNEETDEAMSADKKALENLGNFQIHGWKRGLDSLGGFQIHGWKRAMDSLGGFNVHGWKRSDEDDKRSLESLGNFQVHGWKRSDEDLQTQDQVTADKKALEDLGGFQLHGWKRDDDSMKDNFDSLIDTNDKRLLDSLGSFQVHGYKRGLHNLGGFQVHGYKRGLNHLGGFQVHGWKRTSGQPDVQSDASGEVAAEEEITATAKAPGEDRVRRNTHSQSTSQHAQLEKDDKS